MKSLDSPSSIIRAFSCKEWLEGNINSPITHSWEYGQDELCCDMGGLFEYIDSELSENLRKGYRIQKMEILKHDISFCGKIERISKDIFAYRDYTVVIILEYQQEADNKVP